MSHEPGRHQPGRHEPRPSRTPPVRRTRTLTRAEIQAQVRARKEQFDEANEKITARSGRNLVSAILIGVVLAGVMVVSLVVIKELYLVLAVVLVTFGTLELATALRVAKLHVARIPTVIAGVAVVPAAYYWGATGQWLVALAGMLLVTLWRLVEVAVRQPRSQGPRPDARGLLKDLGAGIFVQVYVSFLASISVLLLAQEGGQWWVLSFIIVVVLVDVGAYASGLNFGKHPMAPTISPKKTWEGLAGALLAALVGGVLLSILLLGQPWWFGLLFGAVITFTATVGDLSESLLKRDIGIKDMSSWLPGHGGFLDRLDSILPSAAAAYLLWVVFGS
ncbi:phosphatidate cytidylyltransferase [Herbiconiux sp. VKM Ac-2851]|jgi:phosphatidate cytidylyltransferase|uniref:phosphatidate cytidylyltransferase n=1 Tax=Herbiconiux sp. VKM Ac-2851 TaxID=2739025 RepID=UPI0015673F7F|nr:phosphatidate cytidylyltransferase [Herbiconiux sp. VKM Ac-2851]NQX36572.1 phosphatidate cytidylyltransferase [Herbiconiux sp. VKM Ac-2851]